MSQGRTAIRSELKMSSFSMQSISSTRLSTLQVQQGTAQQRCHLRSMELQGHRRHRPGQVWAKMYVPSDSFNGLSPEKKAATHLRAMQTFVACKVILSQLAGSGRGELGSYNNQSHSDLIDMLTTVSINDCDDWLRQMMRKNEMLAMRIMEVRAAYAEEDFEWEQLRRLVIKDMRDANLKLMKDYASDAFAKSTEASSS